MTQPSKGARLRAIFSRKGKPVMHISAPNVYTAMMMEQAGFEYIFLGGDVTFGTMLGRAGTYLTTTEKTMIAKFFVKAVSLPVVLDCDEVCGRGPAFHERAVEDYIDVGLAGMDIDDRVLPEERGAGSVAREQMIEAVIPTERMVENIRAASEVRRARDPDFVIRVRCYDFHGPNYTRAQIPLERSIERMRRYVEAGADVIYIGGAGVLSREEIARCVREVPAPCTVPVGWMTYESAAELGLCEFRQPYEIEMAMHAAAWEFMNDFRARGQAATKALRDRYAGNPYMALHGKLRAGPAAV